MRIAILGAPGSDKGTQAKSLAERYRVPHISVDDLLHQANQANQAHEAHEAHQAAAAKTDGQTEPAAKDPEPVTDDTVMALLEERLRARDSKRGFVIDGFPVNIPRAQALDTLLGMLGRGLQIAVHVKVDDETLVRRIVGRMQCGQCGALYNRHYAPSKVRGKCDHCDGKVVSANIGNARAAASKVAKYHETTTPLLAYYKAQHKLRTVTAAGDDGEIRQKICDIVDLEIRPLEVNTLETAAQTLEEEVGIVIAGGQINRIAPAPAPENPAKNPRPHKTTDQKAAQKTAAKKIGKKTTRKTIPKKAVSKKPAARSKVIRKPATGKVATKKPATPKSPVGKTGKAGKTPATTSTAKKAAKKPAKRKPTENEAAKKP